MAETPDGSARGRMAAARKVHRRGREGAGRVHGEGEGLCEPRGHRAHPGSGVEDGSAGDGDADGPDGSDRRGWRADPDRVRGGVAENLQRAAAGRGACARPSIGREARRTGGLAGGTMTPTERYL